MSQCVNRPLPLTEQLLAARRKVRQSLEQPLVDTSDSATEILDAFTVLFTVMPDAFIVGRVRSLYDTYKTHAHPGYVYVFWDKNDPPDTVKIGMTRRRPRRRVQEWRRLLVDKDSDVTLIFSFWCANAMLAEQIVHTLLMCNRSELRVLRAQNRVLNEFFVIPAPVGLEHLRMLIDETCRQINYFFID